MLGRTIPLARPLHAGKLDNDEPFGMPAAFYGLDRTAPDEIATAIFFLRRFLEQWSDTAPQEQG